MEDGAVEGDEDQPVSVQKPSDESPEPVQGPGVDAPRPLAFKIVHPKKPVRRATPSAAANVNILRVSSTTLGLVSLLLPWVMMQTEHGGEYLRLTQYMVEPEYYLVYALVAILVLVGSLLSLMSSYGNLLTLAGIVVFVMDPPSGPLETSVGFWLAAVAASVGCLSIWRSPKLRVPERFLTVRNGPLGDRRVNILALAAFAIGMVTIVLPWFFTTQETYLGAYQRNDYALAWLISDPDFGGGLGFLGAEALVLAGCALCLFTPLGGVVMLSGTLLFLNNMRSYLGVIHTTWIDVEYSLGSGFYLCLAASIMAAASVVRTVNVKMGPALDSRARETVSVTGPTLDTVTPATTTPADVKVSLVGAARSAVRPAMVILLVLAVVVSAAASSYAVPWSRLVVNVSNNDQSSAAEMDVYVDGVVVASSTISPGQQLVVERAVTSGAHTVWVDFVVLEYQEGGPDGVMDLQTSARARPFVMTSIYLGVQVWDSRVPRATMVVSETADGVSVTIEEMIAFAYGGSYGTSIQLSGFSLVMTDGTDFAQWEVTQVNWLEEPEYVNNMGYCMLGDLNVTCIFTDLAVDRAVSAGDWFDLSVESGSFVEGTEYTLYLMCEYDGPPAGQVSFTG